MRFFLLLTFFYVDLAFSNDVPQVTVQGTCDIKVIPDRGVMSFTAENLNKDQKESVAKTTKQMNELKEGIKALNLKDLELKNTRYEVYPVREYEKERYVDKGIRASLTLEVTTSDIQRMGEVMLLASKAGITTVGELTTFLSLEKSREEYLKCLDLAALDAHLKATQLGKKLDFKVDKVLSITETPNIVRPLPIEKTSLMKANFAPATQVEPGTLHYSTNIQVTFRIR